MALILLVLLLRAAIPAGYMLAPGGGLILCPGTAPAATSRHHGTGRHGDAPDHGSGPETPCQFALALAPALPAAPPALAPVLLVPAPLASAPGVAAPPPATAPLRPPATGPPARA